MRKDESVCVKETESGKTGREDTLGQAELFLINNL